MACVVEGSKSFSESLLARVIDDYQPLDPCRIVQREEDELICIVKEEEEECVVPLAGIIDSPARATLWETQVEPLISVAKQGVRKSETIARLVHSKSLNSISTAMYDYIEGVLGLKEDVYEPQFGDKKKIMCQACMWGEEEEGSIGTLMNEGTAVIQHLQSILGAFRVCGLCLNHFCQAHCSFKKTVSPEVVQHSDTTDEETNESGEHWVYVCRACYDKCQTQPLGTTRDHSSKFVGMRAKKRNLTERQQDKIIRKLEKLSFSKAAAQDGNSFSIWSAFPSSPVKFRANSSEATSCICCGNAFSFWAQSQTCDLCSCACCATCCGFKVPLSRSVVNPNSPEGNFGEASACQRCYQLIVKKKQRIKLATLCQSERVIHLTKQYIYISDLKKEIEKHFSQFIAKTETLESSMLSHFHFVGEPEEGLLDSALTEPLNELREEADTYFEQKLAPLFREYKKNVRTFLATKCLNKRDEAVMDRIKFTFQQCHMYDILNQKMEERRIN